jgi:hypothetical protein
MKTKETQEGKRESLGIYHNMIDTRKDTSDHLDHELILDARCQIGIFI